MGQRLNIEIMKNDKVLANAYYHWSAYTESALELCACIIGEINSSPDILPTVFLDTLFRREQIEYVQKHAEAFDQKDLEIKAVTMPGTASSADQDLLYAIRLLEGTGAGINEDEWKRILAEGLCPGIAFRSVVDRNVGLLSISEKGMEETRCWQEGQAVIDLNRKRVYFSVFSEYSLDEYLEEYEIDLEEEPEQMPVEIKESIDFGNFSFKDISKIVDIVRRTKGTGILLPDKTVLSWIA